MTVTTTPPPPRRAIHPLLAAAVRQGYALAVISVAAALAGTMLLRSVVPDRHLSFVLFFAAVAVSAGVGGLWAGVLATLLSALTCDYFFLPPFHSFAVAATDLPLLVLFVAAALLINGVSGRLRAQAQQADRRYYGLVQGLDGIVWEVNPRTLQFTFVSQRAEILLGYPARKWIEEPDFRLRITHPDDCARMKDLWADAISAGGEHTADYRAITADRREIWIRETVYVAHDAHGRPVRIAGLGIDITARKAEAEELLRLKDESATLNKITAALSASLELSDFLRVLQSEVKKRFGVRAGALCLTEDAGGEPRVLDAWGLNGDAARALVAELRPPFGGGPLLAGEGGQLSRLDRCAVSSIAIGEPGEGSGPRMATLIPLLAKDHLRGVLVLCDADRGEIAPGRAEYYATLGRQVGTLLQNVTLYREVGVARERLHVLSRQLVSVQEAERRAIARELHDEVGQVLTGLKLTLEMTPRLPPESRGVQMERALDLVGELIKQVETLSLDLRPPMLDDLGLLAALHWHCKRYTAATGVGVQVEHTGAGGRFPAEVEITAYRVIQEALTNAARHAGVDLVTVRLWAARDVLGLQVVDAGCGFDPAAPPASEPRLGIAGMHERVALLDGHLTMESAPGAGTSITVEIPLTGASQSPEPREQGAPRHEAAEIDLVGEHLAADPREHEPLRQPLAGASQPARPPEQGAPLQPLANGGAAPAGHSSKRRP